MISPQYGLLIILSPNQLTAAGVSFPAFAIMRDTLYEASVKCFRLLVGMRPQFTQFLFKKSKGFSNAVLLLSLKVSFQMS